MRLNQLTSTQRSLAAAGTMVSAAVVVSLFVFSPGLAVVMGGLCALGGFVIFDRIARRLWEKDTSRKLQKLDDASRDLGGEIRQTSIEVGNLRTEIREQEKKRKSARSARIFTAARPANIDAAKDSTGKNDVSADMPLALRAGDIAQNYEEPAIETDISDEAVKRLIDESLRAQRIDMFLQPIMKLPQRKVRFYELLARVRARPGVYVPASRYMKLAEAPTVRAIDRLLLDDALEMLRATAGIERAAPFFVNVTQASLKDGAFMKKLLAFLATHRDLAARLIFELRQDEFRSLDPSVSEVMTAMSKLGCAFSIDNVRMTEFDVTALLRMNIRYIKIPAKNFLPALRSARDLAELTRIKRKLEGNGIAVIAEKIEDEQTLRELNDFDISYGQGFLFGRPDLQGAYQGKTERARRSS